MYNVGLAKVLALEDDGRGRPLRHGQRGEALRPAGLVLGELEQLALVEVQLARLNGKLNERTKLLKSWNCAGSSARKRAWSVEYTWCLRESHLFRSPRVSTVF